MSPQRLRSNDPEGMRNRILDAAFVAFVARGYHATAMTEIRDLAGVSGGAFSHHFPSKKQLGLAVLEARVAGAVAQSWIVPVQKAVTAKAGILAVMTAIITELEGRGRVTGCPLNNLALELSGGDGDFQTACAAIFDRWQGALGVELAGTGCLEDAEKADSLAGFVIAAYSGAMAMAKSRQDVRPLRDCRDMLDQIIP
ncbi:TetR/AcrR family transcriptional regulator [Thalassospira lohafexi]|uniref:TetR family transcriptional regulator n=1 Tax=Thalassospira lohafexi TaxID=744227 RepID=A0A2N3L1P5_9PROT|nr:TetR/AcrR family transcriptional regulator [Thalassospira lohafexi]PKR56728.1 TetR family transcriptional regulator [Thalassospira lohafexi]